MKYKLTLFNCFNCYNMKSKVGYWVGYKCKFYFSSLLFYININSTCVYILYLKFCK